MKGNSGNQYLFKKISEKVTLNFGKFFICV
ncbi:hypothetical protein SAMN05192543_101753 [Paraburkholderia megapolitana]|uniref:Uncharacterized protein n=1 Tax=Paraburkholderia megapolitana TaxID=420953 RepID=A0A1I3E9Q2_9BURK|nr:hypothetical protein SAMN05192543_101753 [Paraburkholderia megapolitana]